MHDFNCKPCNVVFEDFSTYDDAAKKVAPVECPQCGGDCDIIWLKAPGVAGDENLTPTEKVAAALKIGMGADGRLTVPQSRHELKKIRSQIGDFPVGGEIMKRDEKRRDTRTTAQREADKAQTIDMIRRRRALANADAIPRAGIDVEVAKAKETAPINSKTTLAGKRA